MFKKIGAVIFVTVFAFSVFSCKSSKKVSKSNDVAFEVPHVNSGNDINKIIGVWTIVSPAVPENSNLKKTKIITKGHFIWTHTLDNMIVLSLGGTCTFDGETYTENIEYGVSNMRGYFGKKAIYKVMFEGKKMYIIGGTEDESFNEEWERVE